ncbi:MAG TPA: hypothetical protein VK045_11675 [Ornithinicoccus sp.]|nr:hypothetical protein [Ornithinicoccus sp.]
MAEGLGCDGGGIEGLLRLLDEYGEAVEYDLITLGLRLDDLGTERLNWRDLWVIVNNLPRTSALVRAVAGEDAQWGLLEQLVARAADSLEVANWQRQGKAHAPRPKPIPRPGAKSETKTFGKDPIPIKDFDAWWSGAA